MDRFHPSVQVLDSNGNVDRQATAAKIIDIYLHPRSSTYKTIKQKLNAERRQKLIEYKDMPFEQRTQLERPDEKIDNQVIVNHIIQYIIPPALGGKHHVELIMDQPWKGGRSDTVAEMVAGFVQGPTIPMVDAKRDGGRSLLDSLGDRFNQAIDLLPGDNEQGMEKKVQDAIASAPSIDLGPTFDVIQEGAGIAKEAYVEGKKSISRGAIAAEAAAPTVIGNVALGAADLALGSEFVTSKFGEYGDMASTGYSMLRGQTPTGLEGLGSMTTGSRLMAAAGAMSSFGLDMGEYDNEFNAAARLLDPSKNAVQDAEDTLMFLTKLKEIVGPMAEGALGALNIVGRGAGFIGGPVAGFLGDLQNQLVDPFQELITVAPAKLTRVLAEVNAGETPEEELYVILNEVANELGNIQKNARTIGATANNTPLFIDKKKGVPYTEGARGGLNNAVLAARKYVGILNEGQVQGAIMTLRGAILDDDQLLDRGIRLAATSDIPELIQEQISEALPLYGVDDETAAMNAKIRGMIPEGAALATEILVGNEEQIKAATTPVVEKALAGTQLADETANLSTVVGQAVSGGNMADVQGNLASSIGGEFQDVLTGNPIAMIALMGMMGMGMTGVGGMLGGMSGIPLGGPLGSIAGGLMTPLMLRIMLGDENFDEGLGDLNNLIGGFTDPIFQNLPDGMHTMPLMGGMISGAQNNPLRTLFGTLNTMLGLTGMPGGEFMQDALLAESGQGVSDSLLNASLKSDVQAATYQVDPGFIGPMPQGGVPVNQMGNMRQNSMTPQVATVDSNANRVGATTRATNSAALLGNGVTISDPRDGARFTH